MAVILLLIKIHRNRHDTRDVLILHLFLTHMAVIVMYCVGGFSALLLWGLRLVSLYCIFPVLLEAIATLFGKYFARCKPPTESSPLRRTGQIITILFWGSGITLISGYLYTLNKQNPDKPWCRGSHNSLMNGPPKLNASNIFYCSEMGCYLPAHWITPVAFGRELKVRRAAGEEIEFLSTYSTIIETVSGIQNPTRNDYIIHALGPQERENYIRILLMKRPRYVATGNQSFSQHWERWLWYVNWDFYRELIRFYRRDELLFFQTIWSPRPKPLPVSELPVEWSLERKHDDTCDIIVTLNDVTKHNTEGSQIVEIEFQAEASWKPGARLAGGLRHRLHGDALNLDTLLPLDPIHFGIPLDCRVWRIPIEVTPDRGGRIRLQLEPGEFSSLNVEVRAVRHMFPKAELVSCILQTIRPLPVSEVYWKNGILINNPSAAFIVRSTDDVSGITAGTRVRLAESGWRKVVRVQDNVLWLDGPPLSPDGDGFPHPVKIDYDGKQK